MQWLSDNNYQEAGSGGEGGLKDEPHKEKYYVMPPANEGNFSSGPSPDLAKNCDQPSLWRGHSLSLGYFLNWSTPFLIVNLDRPLFSQLELSKNVI